MPLWYFAEWKACLSTHKTIRRPSLSIENLKQMENSVWWAMFTNRSHSNRRAFTQNIVPNTNRITSRCLFVFLKKATRNIWFSHIPDKYPTVRVHRAWSNFVGMIRPPLNTGDALNGSREWMHNFTLAPYLRHTIAVEIAFFKTRL